MGLDLRRNEVHPHGVRKHALGLAAGCLVATAPLVWGQPQPLLDAARQGDAEAVERLLANGADPDTPQADGATALHWAAHHDDLAMATALVEAGAAADTANEFGATPLWLASRNGSLPMTQHLLDAGADANAALPSGETVLLTAARTGNVAVVRRLLDAGADPDAQEHTRGQTALMWAIAERHADVVALLTGRGADVHLRSRERPRRMHTRTAGFEPTGVFDTSQGGNTAMLFAARHGDVESARHLVAAGASVHDASPMGNSALVVAAMSGHGTMASYLLGEGADPNASDAGYTALHGAILRGDADLASALLDAGASPDQPIERGSPGRRNSPDFVLEHDVVGATPFWLAAHFGRPEIMQMLIEHGADASMTTDTGTTALLAAVANRQRVEPGLVADAAEQQRVVHAAAAAALEAGVDVAAADQGGTTALHTAARRRHVTVIRLLVEHGADLEAEDGQGRTPLALAGGDDDNESVAVLRELGATR